MSVCENVKKYEQIVKSGLGISTEGSILNIEFFKDTRQVNVTIKKAEGQKIENVPVILPEDVNAIKDQFLSLIYPHMEAKQVKKKLISDYSEKAEDRKVQIESAYNELIKPEKALYDESIMSLTNEYGFEVKQLEALPADTIEEYKDNQVLIVEARKKFETDKDLLGSSFKEKQESAKQEAFDTIEGTAKQAMEEKINVLYLDYGIERVK